jgi:hypothetical protein
MKLGKETGSLTNHILSRSVIGQPEPQVGMGATILCWTERHAATIIQVWANRKQTYINVQEDHVRRVDKNGMSESQEYEFSPNPQGAISTYRRADDGSWHQVRFNSRTQRWRKTHGEGLRIGERAHYHDFSF